MPNRTVYFILPLVLYGAINAQAMSVPMRSNRVVQTVTTTTTTHFAGNYSNKDQNSTESVYINNNANVSTTLATGTVVGLVAGAAIANSNQPYYYRRPVIFFPFFRPFRPRFGPRPYGPPPFIPHHHFHPGPGPHFHVGFRHMHH